MADFKCKYCEFAYFEDVPNPNGGRWPGGHWAKRICGSCGKFHGWAPTPDNEKIRRPASHKDLVHKFGQGFCELCLRTQEELPSGETMEAHHIVEYANGGSEESDNILIACTSCHKLIHWLRTYHGGRNEIRVHPSDSSGEAAMDLVATGEPQRGDDKAPFYGRWDCREVKHT